MNRDLKEKGLRRPAGLRSLGDPYEPRPEREGIKTAATGKDRSTISYEPRPEREGIKTVFPGEYLHGPMYEPRPEREGIKTVDYCDPRNATGV